LDGALPPPGPGAAAPGSGVLASVPSGSSPPPASSALDVGTGDASGAAGEDLPNGDWRCPSCANVNFAKRFECNRCHAPRPTSGPGSLAAAGGKKSVINIDPLKAGPPGRFKEGDWVCE
jgi:hypothetical protein